MIKVDVDSQPVILFSSLDMEAMSNNGFIGGHPDNGFIVCGVGLEYGQLFNLSLIDVPLDVKFLCVDVSCPAENSRVVGMDADLKAVWEFTQTVRRWTPVKS